ncbi:alanine transaminase [Coemansia sp. RSA 1813]|nr:alanine transaminase [Coemansia sp. RSA 1646]KAJ1767696.1 alanine transaminase [Coemansia sp. RSA 1843]KAJ2090355.1 alanine transaminase [Coemansia sp. RSA 986]KAJ2215541.1 alanine transaminase [Coemansia sp. RSA 487]KAJ2567194.1 alanine transaminase [Coemansia sp. RSA 1813]
MASANATAMPTGTATTAGTKVLTLESMNPNIRTMEYAVRGAIPIRADELHEQLETQPGSLPFKQITPCNIGNPQQLKQKPITFLRQVSALMEYTDLLSPDMIDTTRKLFPADAIERATRNLSYVGNAAGAYTPSLGVLEVRKNVAKFIEERDGFPADPKNICLTTGASGAIERVLDMLVSNPSVGVMIPIPQYPLYTATLAHLDARAVPYYLQEENDWQLSISDLERALSEARAAGTDVRALAVINPGNPTGGCLLESNIAEIVQFCEREQLVLLADEVYQTNIYTGTNPFVSFKKVVSQLGSTVELFSLHSISKGMIGECGRRGGYYEAVNIDDEIMGQLLKLASVSLCPNVQGQMAVDIMVSPPKPGDASYAQYQKEISDIYESMKRRAKKLAAAFNSLPGMTCNEAQGAMYLFPRIQFPQAFIDESKALGREPDSAYCMQLLEATGISVVPGSGFGQAPGTFHFRSTFLPPEHLFDALIDGFKHFHTSFMARYSSPKI